MKAIPSRAVISLTGADTLALLERTVTHSVADWASGDVRFGGLLTPQGKIIADYLATRTEDGVLIDVHIDARDDLMRRLRMFRLRADVSIEPRDDLNVLSSDAGAPDPRHKDLPRRFLIQSSPDSICDAYNTQRLMAGVPEWGSDYRAAEVFPTDVNMDVMGGLDYSKGCFVGQEVASRMKRRGTIRKRTLVIHGEGLQIGDKILAGDVPVGDITSCKNGLGLARIRLDRAEGQSLTVDGAPVSLDLPDWLADRSESEQ